HTSSAVHAVGSRTTTFREKKDAVLSLRDRRRSGYVLPSILTESRPCHAPRSRRLGSGHGSGGLRRVRQGKTSVRASFGSQTRGALTYPWVPGCQANASGPAPARSLGSVRQRIARHVGERV